MSSNYEIRMFENTIMAYVNSSKLDIEIIRVVLSDILGKVNEQADAVVRFEEGQINERKLGESLPGENKLGKQSNTPE